jgi:hypothetical protein
MLETSISNRRYVLMAVNWKSEIVDIFPRVSVDSNFSFCFFHLKSSIPSQTLLRLEIITSIIHQMYFWRHSGKLFLCAGKNTSMQLRWLREGITDRGKKRLELMKFDEPANQETAWETRDYVSFSNNAHVMNYNYFFMSLSSPFFNLRAYHCGTVT